MTPPPGNLPGTASSAAEHALRMSFLGPVTPPLLTRLGEISDGSLILDLACGIGEPTLAVARLHPGARVLGIDADGAALETARGRADDEGLGNAEFQAMSFEDLDLPAASADAAVSRMGVLLTGNPAAAARELARVLRPGAPVSLALWSDMDDNPYMRLGLPTLADVLPGEQVPDLRQRSEVLRSEATVTGWLTQAGIGTVHSEMLGWTVQVPDFDAWWSYNTSAGPLNPLFAGLDDDGRRAARARMTQLMDDERTPSGGYELHSRCRLVWGTM